MNEGLEPTLRRRDQELEFHDVVDAACSSCGCRYQHATEDPQMRWDPGLAWEESCADRECHCHVDPVIGRRPDQEPVNPL